MSTNPNNYRSMKLPASFRATVLAEGMMRIEEWAFCREAQMRLGQGLLLGTPAEKPLTSVHVTS
ncbi:hypothetical protein [Paenibacillus ferrarius]|uniref:hypothetical protein n=1 Tax=Paenibacillus ferrarius TaxID=1469647 RepID=UPI00117DE5FB|nr:hypothetical protein [Paenibacillus ferrarius]